MIYKILFIIFIFCGILVFSNLNIVSSAGYNFTENSGLKETGIETGHVNAEGKYTTVDETIGKIIKAVLSFLGVIFLILTIYGGFLWMMARGNEQQVEKAKTLLIAAVVGLIIVIAAYAISYFVINALGEKTLEQAA